MMTAEERNVLRMLVRMQDDDIRDVERMVSQAQDARGAGLEGLTRRITAKAKTRAQEFEADCNSLAVFIQNSKTAGDPDSAQAQCLDEMLAVQKEKFWQAFARVQEL